VFLRIIASQKKGVRQKWYNRAFYGTGFYTAGDGEKRFPGPGPRRRREFHRRINYPVLSRTGVWRSSGHPVAEKLQELAPYWGRRFRVPRFFQGGAGNDPGTFFCKVCGKFFYTENILGKKPEFFRTCIENKIPACNETWLYPIFTHRHDIFLGQNENCQGL